MRTSASRTPPPSASPEPHPGAPDLTDRLKAEANRLGFDQVGIAPAVAPPGYGHYLDWLRRGDAAGMADMHREAEVRAHPYPLLERLRSVVVCAFVYGRRGRPSSEPRRGKVARYA